MNFYRLFGKNRIPRHFRNLNEVDFSPVFLIGGNRTGTSMTAAILSQHPELEGLFDLPEGIVTRKEKTNHTSGYCSSAHIWKSLNKESGDWNPNRNEGVLWGHPKHISRFYKDRPQSGKQALSLANEIQFHRKTGKIPLIKNHFNLFRIGLITKIFPDARFVLTVRNYKDYIPSSYHKWCRYGRDLEIPKIGLHWLVLHTTCLYDLQKYARNRFCIIDYADLFKEPESVNNMLKEKLIEIRLKPHVFDLGIINMENRFNGNDYIHPFENDNYFRIIDELLSFEIDSLGVNS